LFLYTSIHFIEPTDTIGALGVSVALVLATALAIDGLTTRLQPRDPVDVVEQPVS